MTRANILRGWRDPNEDPKIYATLLVVYRDKRDGFIFVSTVSANVGIEYARNNPDYTFLAWQYLPGWEHE